MGDLTGGSRRSAWPRYVGALAWLLPAATVYWVLSSTGVENGDILRYTGYFVGCVALPGVLLLRAFAPARRTWPEDIGLGIVVGLAYELPGWALFTAAGIEKWLVVWPATVVVVFAAVPPLWRYWRAQGSPRLPFAWSASLSVLMSAVVLIYYGTSVSALPILQNGGDYYQDILWHLGIVHELGRSVPPQIPQVAGETMHYHWFADAHIASAAHITGIDAGLVLFRLWFAPIIVALVLAIAALARLVSRAWWTAPLAVAVSTVVPRVAIWKYVGGTGSAPLVFLSPSQSFGTTVSVGAAALLIGVLYRGAPRRSWVIALLVVCACAGAKPTAVPLLLGGTGVAALFLLVRKWRIAWPTIGLGVVLVGVLTASSLAVVGSSAGTPLRLFGVLRAFPGYSALTGVNGAPAPGGWIIQGLEGANQQTVDWAIAILVAILVSKAVMVVSFLGLGQRKTRTDPAQWWLVGSLIAALLGFLIIDHPAYGQLYFIGSSMPFAGVAAAYVVHGAVAGHRRAARRVVIVGGLLAGTGLALAIRAFGNVKTRPVQPTDIAQAVNRPMLWLAAALGVGLLLWLVLRIVRPQVRGLGLALLACVAVSLAFPSRPWSEWTGAVDGITGKRQNPVPALPLYSTDEIQAALWLGHNAGQDDVVVTNTACLARRRPGPICDARGYLVSGVGGHRTLMEGWAYTQQSMANQGTEGTLGYSLLASPWPDRVELSKKALTAPTSDLLARLRREYGVRWIFADTRKGKVAERQLDQLAERRYTQGEVIIYELKD